MSLTVLLPWQHTGFLTSPLLKAFLATFGISFRYLLMEPYLHDPVSIWICSVGFVPSFNVFRAENDEHIEIK